ncbi:MAG TPA: SMP-30/gluconolactonase/LRE family protein [candidate division Zixibacteria bacterium]|nr:SMP-30/gluconolactonase/LRE family protein [candidate division Zixibacteria bacterium]
MRTLLLVLVMGLQACAAMRTGRSEVSILVDLDPARADRSVIVEAITADKAGRLYLPDRVSGNVLRIDPEAPRPVVVGRIEPREIKGKKVGADAGGLAFNGQGDLLIAAGGFSEVLRIRASELDPGKPGRAETFATGVPGANAVALDRRGNLYVSGGRAGKIYRVGPGGGAAQPIVQIPPHSRKVPGGGVQPIVENGLAFDANGVLHVADTARGAIWKVPISADGAVGKPVMLAQSPLLEGADGIEFDARGTLWVAANERNAIATVAPDGSVREVWKNDSRGPLEFPSGIVFVGGTAYVSNFDVPRRDNLDSSGKTALDGIGASVAMIVP